MAKPIDDTRLLDAMAEEILRGRAHTPTGAMRLHGVEDGSADERRLLRKWKDGEGLKSMEIAARLILKATVECHREELSQHGFREYERGFDAGRAETRECARMKAWAEMPQLGERRPSWLSRLFTWAA